MEKLNKKDKLHIIKAVSEALDKGENLIVKTDGLSLIQGEALRTMANIAHIIKEIQEKGIAGKMLVEAFIDTIKRGGLKDGKKIHRRANKKNSKESNRRNKERHEKIK